MLYITQLITRASDNEKLLFLGLDSDWKSHFLDKNLNEIKDENLYQEQERYLTNTDDKVLEKSCGFFGLVNLDEFWKYYSREDIRKFIMGEI